MWSGVAVVAAPDVEDAHAIGHAGYALWVFAIPLLLASLVEAPLALLSDRIGRGRVLRLSLCALGASLAFCAFAARPWLLSLGLGLAGAASGAACASAQGELVSSSGAGRADRAMSRWAAFAAGGDILAPLVVGAVIWTGGTHRAAFLLVAALVTAQAWVPRPRAAAGAEPSIPAGTPHRDEPLRAALVRPRLWALLLAAAVCTLLDEVLVALAGLRLARELGASEALTAASLAALSASELGGAAITGKIVATRSARAVLAASACASAACLALLVAARTPLQTLGALVAVGASAAPHHPLLMAAAYDAVPGRPGLVNAAAQVFVVVEVALPLAIGAVAERHGLGAALGALAIQPVTVLLAALAMRRRRGG